MPASEAVWALKAPLSSVQQIVSACGPECRDWLSVWSATSMLTAMLCMCRGRMPSLDVRARAIRLW